MNEYTNTPENLPTPEETKDGAQNAPDEKDVNTTPSLSPETPPGNNSNPKFKLNDESPSNTWENIVKPNLREIEEMRMKGADVHAQDKDGSTPILFATFGGKLDILKTLIKHGANIKSTNSYRLSPLMLAAKTGNLQITKFLLELDNTPNPSSNPQAPTNTPLSHDSSEEGDPRSGAKSETHLHTSPPSASAEWCFCSSSRSDEEEDPQRGQDVGGVAAKDEFSRTPLFFATENGNTQIVELLLKHHADPNVSDDFEKTPIQIATENNRQDLIELFNDYTSQTTSPALNSPPHTNNQPTTNQPLPLEREGGPVANATGDRMKREHRSRKKSVKQLRNRVSAPRSPPPVKFRA